MRFRSTIVSFLFALSFNALAAPALVGIETARLPGKEPAGIAGPDIDRPVSPAAPTASSQYTFATTTTASLVDMSSGTTQLIAPDVDDGVSPVTLIGFDFYFQGQRQDRFTVTSNGLLRFGSTAASTVLYDPLAQAGQLLIAPYGADQRTHVGDGKVHYKVIGTAPNRTLVIEWRNMQANFQSAGTADLTYQLQLAELAGTMRFVYGSMSMTAIGAADTNSQSPQIGFSSNNTVDSIGTITAPQSGTPAPTFDGAAAAPVNNLYTAGTIPALTSAADGSRRDFTITPPPVTAPGALSFTAVGVQTITVNWADSPDELGYSIYASTDGVNFNFVGSAAQNATSFVANNLVASTTYTWQVHAFREGARAFSSGVQGTATPNMVVSAASGPWSSTATWLGGAIPTTDDAVVISTGTTVTIDTAAFAYTVSVAGSATLDWDPTTARTLNVVTDVTVQTNGAFQVQFAGATTGHALTLGGSLTNNGTIDFSANADTSGASIVFNGATSATFGGTGAITNVRAITVDKGTSIASVLELMPSSFIVRGSTGDSAGGLLTLNNGLFKISGTFPGSHHLFNVASYAIPATTGFWLNNPNYTIAPQNGTGTVSGLFRVSQGTYNVGTALGNSLAFAAGSTIVVEGGAINTSGRFGVSAAANIFSYTQSGGTITTCTVGHTSTTLACYDLGTSTSSSISVTGGTAVVQIASTAASGPRDYRFQSGLGINSAIGGTVQLGNANSGVAKAFNVVGVMPKLILTNLSAPHTATFNAPAIYNNISRDITIMPGTTLNLGNQVFLFNGTTLTNNGTLTHNGASSNFVPFLTTAPQLYTGTGVVTAPMTAFGMQADQGFTFDPASAPVTALSVRLFTGSIFNASKLILGNGAATTATIQIGNTTTPTAAGILDSAPTFNPGTGGIALSYLRTTAARSTGFEVPAARTITTLRLDENDASHPLTLAGGDLTATGTTTFVNGRMITNANTLIIGSAGTLTRTGGHVDGNLRKTFTAAGAKTFEVGSANGYSPASVNATAGTFPADVTLKATQTTAPGFTPAAKAITRYWTTTATGITADLVFTYLDPTDIPGTATEANFHVYQSAANNYNDISATVDTAANTGTAPGVTTFTTFTLGEPGGSGSPVLDISPAGGIAFGNVAVGGSAGPTSVTLTNSGVGTLTISALDTANAPFARTGGSCSAMLPFTLTAGASCTLSYSFTPTAIGAASQNLNVTNDGPSNGVIALTGTGTQGHLTIAPTSLSFGSQPVGVATMAQTVTLGNDGNASLDVTVLTAATAPFARSGGTCGAMLPITIAAGGSCTLDYTFTPTASGAANQQLTVTANQPGGGTIDLSGTGIQGNLTVAPSTLSFGTVPVGSTTAFAGVTLGNDGTASLQVTALTLAAPPFARTTDGTCGNSLPITIAVGSSCTVTYTFSPTSMGLQSQLFSITRDGTGATSFTLQGTGAFVDSIFKDGFE